MSEHRGSADPLFSRESSSGLVSLSSSAAAPLWFERLHQASEEAPRDAGPAAIVLHFLQLATKILPAFGVGVVVSMPAGDTLRLRVPDGPVGDSSLFPEMAQERSLPVGAFGGTLRWGLCDPLATPDDNQSLFLRLLARAVGHALLEASDIARQQELAALQRQLAQSDKLASVGRMTASTLHEINNPVTAILTYAQFLRRKATRGPLDAGDLERLERISEAAEHIHLLAQEMTDFARPSGEFWGEVSLGEIAARALRFCEHTVVDVGATVESLLTEPAPRVRGSASELTQILINLITNACHAMPRGHGRLSLQIEADEQNAYLRVRDNGHGISPEHLPRIFDPFFTTKALGSGTGLGLSVVRAIVERHQGEIWVDPVATPGSLFVVRLPRLG